MSLGGSQFSGSEPSYTIPTSLSYFGLGDIIVRVCSVITWEAKQQELLGRIWLTKHKCLCHLESAGPDKCDVGSIGVDLEFELLARWNNIGNLNWCQTPVFRQLNCSLSDLCCILSCTHHQKYWFKKFEIGGLETGVSGSSVLSLQAI